MQASPVDTEQGTHWRVHEARAQGLHERRVLLVLFLLGGVYASLLLLSDLLPFVDLPFHLAAATVVRGYGKAGNQFSDYFTLQLAGQPNVFHLWFCSRSIFPSVEFANKLYFALYTFLLPLSLYVLIRELRGNTWFSVLSYLYLYNFSTHWGFVGFVGAIPAVFFLFAVVVRHLQRPSRWTHLGIAFGSLMLFFIHVLALLFFLCAYWLTCVTGLWPDRRRIAGSFALTVPALALIGWWWFGRETNGGESTFAFLVRYYQDLFTQSFRIRSLMFIFDNSYLAEGRRGLVWGGLIAAVSISLFAWSAAFEWSSLLTVLKDRRHRAVIALVVAAGLCFFLLPSELPGQWGLNQRFSVYIVLGMIVLSSLLELRRFPRRLIVAVILCSCLLHAVLYADYFRDFGIESDGFTEEILPEDGGKVLAGLILEPHFRGLLSYLHFPNYYIVRRQGIAVTRMVEFRFGAVRRRPGGRDLPEALMRFDRQPDYAGEYDDVDFLVVRGEIPPRMRASLHRFEEAIRRGRWSLFVHR